MRAAAIGFSLLLCVSAEAQPVRPYSPSYPPQYPQPLPVATGAGALPAMKSLKARIGLDSARALLTADDPKARVRGVERLGSLTDPQAIDTLLEALDPGTILSRDLDARLMAVRILAEHANRPEVRAYLARELMAAASPSRTTTGMGFVVRGSAAMALGRQGDEKSLAALLVALDQRGPASDAARTALLAYPPRTLDVFLFAPDDDVSASSNDDATADEESAAEESHEAPRNLDKNSKTAKRDVTEAPPETPKKHARKPRALSPVEIDLLGDLGDMRAVAALRATLTNARAQAQSRAHAALALARFGDNSGAVDARKWARASDDKLVEIGARTLILLDDWSEDVPSDAKPPKLDAAAAHSTPASSGVAALADDPSKSIKTPAVRAVARLLAVASTRRAAMELIADSRSPERFRPVVAALDTIAHETSGADRSVALLTVARVAGASHMSSWLDSDLAHVAAYALATLAGDDATNALATALHTAKTSKARLLARAGVVRAVMLGIKVPGLDDALRSLGRSTDEADIEASAFGRIALGESVADVLGDLSGPHAKAPKAAVVAGVARATLLSGKGALTELAPLLADANDDQEPSLVHVSAGVALLTPEGRKAVPQKTLLAWVEGGGALAPLAAYALPSRDDDAIHPRIKELLLEGTDPVVRAHVALGLANDPDPSVTSLLVTACMNDVSAPVRRAAVRALSRRTEPQRERALRLAHELDPDDAVRALAARALRGPIEETPLSLGLAISWTKIEETEGPPRAIAGRYLREDGFALPFVSSTDGDVLEPAPSFGPASLSLYPDRGLAHASPKPASPAKP